MASSEFSSARVNDDLEKDRGDLEKVSGTIDVRDAMARTANLDGISGLRGGGGEASFTARQNPLFQSRVDVENVNNRDDFPVLQGASSPSVSVEIQSRVREVQGGEASLNLPDMKSKLPPTNSFLNSSAKPLYSSVVDKNNDLPKFTLNVPVVAGIVEASIPGDVLADAPPLWTDLVIGRFQDKSPSYTTINNIVNKIWTVNVPKMKIEVFMVNERLVKFRIPDTDKRNYVLRRGMWNIAGQPMVISKWSPIAEETTPSFKTLPMWVHLKGVPRHLFTRKGLSWLVSPAGEGKYLHPDTLQCKSFEEAKVFVEVDLQKELVNEFKVEGVEKPVLFHYPWLPKRCSKCFKWVHVAIKCSIPGIELAQRVEEIEEGEIRDGGNASGKDIELEDELMKEANNEVPAGSVINQVVLRELNGRDGVEGEAYVRDGVEGGGDGVEGEVDAILARKIMINVDMEKDKTQKTAVPLDENLMYPVARDVSEVDVSIARVEAAVRASGSDYDNLIKEHIQAVESQQVVANVEVTDDSTGWQKVSSPTRRGHANITTRNDDTINLQSSYEALAKLGDEEVEVPVRKAVGKKTSSSSDTVRFTRSSVRQKTTNVTAQVLGRKSRQH